MPLSDDWTDSIIRRLHTRYGTSWTAKWASLPPEDVRDDWAAELEDLSYERVKYGLKHLPPDFPPNAGEFKAICMEMRAPEVPQPLRVEGPPATPIDRERVKKMLRDVRDRLTGRA